MNYYIVNSSDYLEHHGILGMKWGIRRYQNPDGSLTSAGKKRYSDDYNEYKQLKKKKVSSLSNEELKKVTDRMELEKKYKEYKSKGSEFISEQFAKSLGKNLANALSITLVAAGGMYLAKKYNINAKTITRKIVETAGDITSTAAKEAAKGVSNVAKTAAASATTAARTAASSAATAARRGADNAGRSYVKAVDKVIGQDVGRRYVETVDSILNGMRRRRR